MPRVFRTVSYTGLNMPECVLENYHVWIDFGDASPIRVSKRENGNSCARQVSCECVLSGGKDGNTGNTYYSLPDCVGPLPFLPPRAGILSGESARHSCEGVCEHVHARVRVRVRVYVCVGGRVLTSGDFPVCVQAYK